MNHTPLNHLLTKLQSNQISLNEWEELKKTVDTTDEDALIRALEHNWNQGQPIPLTAHGEKEVKNLWPSIRNKTQKQGFRISMPKLMQVAAVALVLILSGVTIYLQQDRQRMQLIGQNELVIEVPKGQKVSVKLPDGSTAFLNSASTLRYQQNYGLKDRVVTLDGEGYFDIKKDPSKEFTVQTSALDIVVLGTSFNVYAYETSDQIEIALISGQVKIQTHSYPSQTMIVHPNEKIRYEKAAEKLHLEKTDLRASTAWTRGELAFRSEPLIQVLSKIERRYDIQIHLQAEDIQHDRFTGYFDGNSLEEVLNSLQLHYRFDYQKKGKEVWIVKAKPI